MEKASFVGGVWMSSSTSEVYFSVDKDAAFHLKRFDTEEEPKFILEVLKEKGHPNFAQVSPVFQVEDAQYYYLAFKKHGVSLEDFLKDDENKKRFSNKHLISSFYQKLLVDLLRVWRHLVGLRVKCDLKLKNVYIYDDGDDPHVSLVDFSTGGASCNKWDELVALVTEINTNCHYAYGNREMQLFLRIIKDGYKNEMENLSNNSLFWSLKQRRSLTCDLWDLVKNDEHFEIYEEEQIFSADPTRWRLVFYQDTKLKELVDHVERFNTGKVSSSNLAVRNPRDFATRCCLKVIRKTFAHFQSINRKVTYNIRNNTPTKNLLQHGQKAFGTVEEFQLLMESSFPYYIPALRKKALVLQRRTGLQIVPEDPILKNLFTERN